MPACPLSTLRRPPYDEPTQDSGSQLVASHYYVGDFHPLPFAGFYRRFQPDPKAFSLVVSLEFASGGLWISGDGGRSLTTISGNGFCWLLIGRMMLRDGKGIVTN